MLNMKAYASINSELDIFFKLKWLFLVYSHDDRSEVNFISHKCSF